MGVSPISMHKISPHLPIEFSHLQGSPMSPGESEKPKLRIPTKSPRPVGCWAFPNLSFKAWKLENATRKTPKSQLPQVAHGKCGIHGIEKKNGPKMVGGGKIPKVNKRSPKKPENPDFLLESRIQSISFCLLLATPFFWGFMVLKLQGSFHEFTACPKDTATRDPPTCRVSLLLPFLLGLFSVSINRFITRSSRLYLTMNSQMSGSSNSCSGLDKTVKPTVDSAKKDTWKIEVENFSAENINMWSLQLS